MKEPLQEDKGSASRIDEGLGTMGAGLPTERQHSKVVRDSLTTSVFDCRALESILCPSLFHL